MPKWLLFGLAAVGQFVLAVVFFNTGRVVIPAILVLAGVCMSIAAIGQAMGKGK
ncbi:MAG TPA: hypothetical protein VK363_19315 [Pyrinomonadaceae bacterium]|nr:hypothetical protein [Pyrinomonadaceae bacterium]